MSSRTIDPRHYRSRVRSGLRLFTQDVLMHGTIWTLCDVHVHHRELLDTVEAPFIVVANHSSHLDAPLVFGALPHRLSKHLAAGAAADYFFKNKVKGAATSLFFNAYPVERKGVRTRKGITGQLLDEGIPLLIFPEGTRSRTGAIGHFTPGVAALSISHDIPVLPVALVGAHQAWPVHRAMPPTDRPDVHVVFGHPLTPIPGEIAHQFADRMRRIVAELHDATARAYKMPTLADYERSVVLSQAASPASPLVVGPGAATAPDAPAAISPGVAPPTDPSAVIGPPAPTAPSPPAAPAARRKGRWGRKAATPSSDRASRRDPEPEPPAPEGGAAAQRTGEPAPTPRQGHQPAAPAARGTSAGPETVGQPAPTPRPETGRRRANAPAATPRADQHGTNPETPAPHTGPRRAQPETPAPDTGRRGAKAETPAAEAGRHGHKAAPRVDSASPWELEADIPTHRICRRGTRAAHRPDPIARQGHHAEPPPHPTAPADSASPRDLEVELPTQPTTRRARKAAGEADSHDRRGPHVAAPRETRRGCGQPPAPPDSTGGSASGDGP